MKAESVEPAIAVIRALPFVSGVRLAPRKGEGPGTVMKIASPGGVFQFTMEVQRSYLSRTGLSLLLAARGRLERDGQPPPLVLARYISREGGQELARGGVCFADEAGNVNLRLGERYHTLVLGNRDTVRAGRARRLTPAAVQLLLVALAEPEALRAPVRQLAQTAGVGKSVVGEARRHLVEERLVLTNSAGDYRLADEKTIRERFLVGYSQVLRPRLQVGRFRGPYRDGSAFVEALRKVSGERPLRWALTGGAAAFELDRLYRGEETVCFVWEWDDRLAKSLQMIPDAAGPITILEPFGSLVAWKEPEPRPIAHPWLVYAELMHDGGPRAIDAAEELRRNHLA